MEAVAEQLKTVAPNRLVTRDLTEFMNRETTERQQGVFTVLMGTEGDYPNYVGREGQLGTVSLSIIGQIEIPEPSTGLMVEDAEHVMVKELKNLAQSDLPEPIGGLLLQRVRHSMQIDRPYGWVVSEWLIE